MDRDGRRLVVSVRISDVDQQRLRRMADARGTTISDLVRSAALREAGGDQQVVTVTTAPASQTCEIGKGLTWNAAPGAQVNGNTFTR
jgi:uncharacterized protein (DUF1778 family)